MLVVHDLTHAKIINCVSQVTLRDLTNVGALLDFQLGASE